MTGKSRFSFGKVVGAIAAVFTIIGSLIALWDRFFPVENATPRAVAMPEMIALADLSELEQQLAGQIQSLLSGSGCSDAALVAVEASEKSTPAGQTTSGFKGFFLEGSATLTVGDRTRKIRLVGNGKGPAAQSDAMTMASEKFLNMVKNDSSLSLDCDN